MPSSKVLKSVAVFMAAAVLFGCASTAKKVLPKYDEVLTFPMPYDLTYLRTVEALESVNGWELAMTEKEKGFIELQNTNYLQPGDADLRKAKFLVKRVGSRQTSVQLDPEYQHVRDGDKLMKQIASYNARELES